MPDLEVTLWAASPMILNPTNMDTDKEGRIWVAEGVNYRSHYNRKPEGDRIMVLEDTDGDGRADRSWAFVQEEFLRAPMGVAVIDNRIVVSMTPDLVVYTDVNRDLKFDPAVDKREALLTGFNGRIHDHSLHSVTVGPDGQWYWNAGNCGALFTDKSGKTFRVGSDYDPYYGRKNPGDLNWSPREIAGQISDDGHVYVGGFAARMNPDGTQVYIIGQNFRNSYEQAVTSFGDVFHTDNDDPPACRATWLMEHANMGFSSFDGKRSWGADRRPGQDTPTAQWRQEDPGTTPPGDVYGGGSPTGVAFYEDGALGRDYRGMFLACEPGRNTVFGYFPKPEGAGFKMERFDFLTSNKEGEFAGSDFKGGRPNEDFKTRFRPSDVMVGADGAIYVADWFDPRVGGHSDLDGTLSGAIYRIAPKGFKPKVAKFDLTKTDGQIAALRSPAVNVRSLGFNALKEQGEKAVADVARLLKDDHSYVQARAVWLLSQLGPKGIDKVEDMLKHRDEQLRIAAFRALRRHVETEGRKAIKRPGPKEWFLSRAAKLAKDRSSAVRREVALALRDVPFGQSGEIIRTLAAGYDGEDRWYLEALGTASTGKEARVYDLLSAEFGSADSLKWSDAFADIAWRLHVPRATDGFRARALSPALPVESRKAALVALAYIGTRESSHAILDAAQKSAGPVQAEAMWWLLNRKDSVWKDHGIDAELKRRGLFDPEKVELASITVPEPPASQLTVDGVLKLKGDAARGAQLATACLTCHTIQGQGAAFGPDITAFARMQPADVVVRSMIAPSADISHGYGGQVVETKDGLVIHGIVLTDGNPTVVASQGGIIQMVPRDKIKSKGPLNRSLMLSAEQMGMGAQEVADVLAYMKTLN
ncbi:MAG TPA: dehydrogenase [Verrucomicrobiales bacterium]|nr:dehydrogenase [Verrucomicrobiales bacterium]